MDTSIGPLGYSISLKTLPPHFLEDIRRELTVKPIENPNFPSAVSYFPVFRVSKNNVYLPRYYGIQKYSMPLNNTLTETPISTGPFEGTLRPIQEETINKTLMCLKENYGGIISLSTGLGKTVVALKLIEILKIKTIIVVHAEFLLDQWVERIKQYLPSIRIGIIRQERCEIENDDVVVGMLQTIISREFPKNTFDSFSLLISDENHHTAARSFSGLFYKIQTKYMIGLSATPERKDGLSKVLYWFFGPQIVNIKRETDNPSVRFLFTDVSLFEERFNKLGKINNPTMITDLTKNKLRNLLIIDTIKSLLKESRKILILSDRRDHCLFLLSCLDGISAGVYLGGMTTANRALTVECSVIIGTYQASGEGFDVPELDTLIMATPKSDVEQAIGRILRQKNKNEPLIIDISDSFSIFKAQFAKRKRFYKNNNVKVIS